MIRIIWFHRFFLDIYSIFIIIYWELFVQIIISLSRKSDILFNLIWNQKETSYVYAIYVYDDI